MRLKGGGPFEATLDGPSRARFIAARTKLGEPADHYGTKNALAAGLILATDYRTGPRLPRRPTKLIKLLAARAKVPVSQKSYDIGPLMGPSPHAADRGARLVSTRCWRRSSGPASPTRPPGPGRRVTCAARWPRADLERCIGLVPGARPSTPGEGRPGGGHRGRR